MYKEPVRTNNDLEGWHNALNRRAGGQCGLPLYLLIELLDREAKLTAITIRLVSDNKLKRIQRRTTRNIQANYSQVGRSMRTTRKPLLNYSGRARNSFLSFLERCNSLRENHSAIIQELDHFRKMVCNCCFIFPVKHAVSTMIGKNTPPLKTQQLLHFTERNVHDLHRLFVTQSAIVI